MNDEQHQDEIEEADEADAMVPASLPGLVTYKAVFIPPGLQPNHPIRDVFNDLDLPEQGPGGCWYLQGHDLDRSARVVVEAAFVRIDDRILCARVTLNRPYQCPGVFERLQGWAEALWAQDLPVTNFHEPAEP